MRHFFTLDRIYHVLGITVCCGFIGNSSPVTVFLNVRPVDMWTHVLHRGWLHWQLPLYDSFVERMDTLTKRSLTLGGQRNTTKKGEELAQPNHSDMSIIGRCRSRMPFK